jgi:hypothetical protein
MDAYAWKRMCSSFQKAFADLCAALVSVARRIASTFVDPEPRKPLVKCRLIALDKCPGVRPIGIGEVSRCVINKAILSVIQEDIREVIGSKQLCVGQKSGCEAAVHAIKEIFKRDTTDEILLVDASNDFNSLNRKAALANALRLCPALGTALVNTYRSDSDLYIDGEAILSREGTTQGDPMAMAMYAIGTLTSHPTASDSIESYPNMACGQLCCRWLYQAASSVVGPTSGGTCVWIPHQCQQNLASRERGNLRRSTEMLP